MVNSSIKPWVESSEAFLAQIAFSNTKVLYSRKGFAIQFCNFVLGYCRIREEKHAIFLQKCTLIIAIADFTKLQGVICECSSPAVDRCVNAKNKNKFSFGFVTSVVNISVNKCICLQLESKLI